MKQDKMSYEELLTEFTKLKEENISINEERLSSIMSNIDVGLLLQGPKAEIILSNNRAFEMLGLTEDQLLGKTSFDEDWNVIHEDGSPFPGYTHPVPKAIKTKLPVKDVVMGVHRSSTKDRIWLLVSAIPILNPDGSILHVVCSFIDITKRKKAEDELQKSLKRLSILYEIYKSTTEILDMKALLKNAIAVLKEAFFIDAIGIYLLDENTQTVNLEPYSGYMEEFVQAVEVLKIDNFLSGKAITTKRPQFSSDTDYPYKELKPFINKQNFKSTLSIPMITGDKAIGAINISFKRERQFEDDEIQLLMSIGRQLGIAIQNARLVDSLKHLTTKLELESKVDLLTGLYNRRYILQEIKSELNNYTANDSKFSIAIGDIDFFKKVNDTYGHDFGDFVLKTVSEILKDSLKETDCLARWGGEEFLFMLRESDLEKSKHTIDRIRQNIENKIFEHNGASMHVTMTFGISTYNGNESIDDIIKKADDALYSGKQKGRNCVVTD